MMSKLVAGNKNTIQDCSLGDHARSRWFLFLPLSSFLLSLLRRARYREKDSLVKYLDLFGHAESQQGKQTTTATPCGALQVVRRSWTARVVFYFHGCLFHHGKARHGGGLGMGVLSFLVVLGRKLLRACEPAAVYVDGRSSHEPVCREK